MLRVIVEHVSDSRFREVSMLDLLLPEPGAFYFMDCGYVDFVPLYRLDQAGTFVVTRAKRNLDA